MTADRAAVADFASELREAERNGTPTPLASERFDDLDWDHARRIALARDALRIDDGDELIGYKLGWTSAAMREALGIERPNWGTLWRSQRCDGVLDLTTLRHAKLEPELVYVAARPSSGTDVTADDVARRARGWAVGIEVVHPRWPTFDFTWLDNTADNSSAHAIAVGSTHPFHGDPAALIVHFGHSGGDGADVERDGSGSAAMGSPAEAVAWLVRSLASEGRRLDAGQIVFTGGLTAPFDAVAGTRYHARCDQLGAVELLATRPEGS